MKRLECFRRRQQLLAAAQRRPRARTAMRLRTALVLVTLGAAGWSPGIDAQTPSLFRRGDINVDGAVDVSDAIGLLAGLFRGVALPPCDDAADANDSGDLDLSDAIFVLGYLFRGAARPPHPGPNLCGRDPTPDELSCDEYLATVPEFNCENAVEQVFRGRFYGSILITPIVSDLNGDGRLDVIGVRNRSLVVMPGVGGGTFGAPRSYPAPRPSDLRLLDVDGDGIRDAVTISPGGRSLSVFRGFEDGTFDDATTTAFTDEPVGFDAGDLNGDLRGDFVVTVLSAAGIASLETWIGTPDLAALERRFTTVVIDTPRIGDAVDGNSPRLGDFNSDGMNDVVIVGAALRFFWGSGDGILTPGPTRQLAEPAHALVVAEFGGGPDVDLAVATTTSISVLRGLGTGTFEAATQLPVETVSLAVGDVDSDGDGDIVADGVTLLRNDDALRFTLVRNGWPDARGPAALQDLDDDGNADLVVPASGGVVVLKGSGSADFPAPHLQPTTTRQTNIAVEDFDDDARVDFAVTSESSDRVLIFLGSDGNRFDTLQSFSVGSDPSFVLAADVDDDAITDLVVLSLEDDSMSILLGSGDGTFSPPRSQLVGDSPRGVAAADIDDDGATDLVVANGGVNSFSRGSLLVLRGSGQGSFPESRPLPSSRRPWAVSIAHVNSDDVLDILVANERSSTVTVHVGTGDGQFQQARDYLVDVQPTSLAVGDLDGDGNLDFVTGNDRGHSVTAYLGLGDGRFDRAGTFGLGFETSDISVVDIDGDGLVDVLATTSGTGQLAVFRGHGDGWLSPPESYPAGVGSRAFAPADVDGDGDFDVLITNVARDGVTVLENSAVR